RDAGIDVEHVGAGSNLSERVDFDATEVAALHLFGQQLASGRVDLLADHHEGTFEADHHLTGFRADNCVGHVFSCSFSSSSSSSRAASTSRSTTAVVTTSASQPP